MKGNFRPRRRVESSRRTFADDAELNDFDMMATTATAGLPDIIRQKGKQR